MYTVSTVQEQVYEERKRISTPKDVQVLMTEHFDPHKERFYVLLLNTKNELLKVDLVSVGSLNASIAHPREILKSAILESAASIILVHNHPTGDPTPSNEDVEFSRRMAKCCELMGIALLDHVIVGNGTGCFASLKEKGVF